MGTQSIGDRLKTLRERRGWTQGHLAEIADVSERTVQRIEQGEHRPTDETLKALATSFDMEVTQLKTGFNSEDLAVFESEFLCPTCGSVLLERTFVPHEYGDTEHEVFECGFTRGVQWRPCPKDPRFPKFEDYELHYSQESDGRWVCYAMGKTDMARTVGLNHACGRTKEVAEMRVRYYYINIRDGNEAATKFLKEQLEVMGPF